MGKVGRVVGRDVYSARVVGIEGVGVWGLIGLLGSTSADRLVGLKRLIVMLGL